MITVYKKCKKEAVVNINDVYFNRTTAELLDDRARDIIEAIDHSEMLDRFHIKSRFDGSELNIDKLSTGCKTALNILYNPEQIFDIGECGENAIDIIYAFEEGKVYCSYPLISFDMDKVSVIDGAVERIIDSYEELKEWWQN